MKAREPGVSGDDCRICSIRHSSMRMNGREDSAKFLLIVSLAGPLDQHFSFLTVSNVASWRLKK